MQPTCSRGIGAFLTGIVTFAISLACQVFLVPSQALSTTKHLPSVEVIGIGVFGVWILDALEIRKQGSAI